MTQSAIPSPPPVDWSTIKTTVECPLCLYNLRGLSDSRCPECGYSFDWAELLEPGRARHRYLFEHHPQRNLWSFYRTLLGGVRRKKFWTELIASQVLRPRRLIIYWLLCTLLAGSALGQRQPPKPPTQKPVGGKNRGRL